MPKKVSIGGALDWKALELSESVRGINVEVDDHGYIQGSINPPLLWNSVTKTLELQRVPSRYIALSGATDTTLVWTPAPGKTIRIMGGEITISKDAACAAALHLYFLDTVSFKEFQISAAALVATGNVVYLPFSMPANGRLCSPAGTPLFLYFSGALTAGSLSINVWGTEE